MSDHILYCGDTHLGDAAAYLTGLLHHWGMEFRYLSSETALAEDGLSNGCRLVILSDYPATNASEAVQRKLCERVAGGCGLLMIGGWESYHGLGGDWDGTPVADALPVHIASEDDRRNLDSPVLVSRTTGHPIVDGLPWESRPPVIGGLNEFTPKANATVLLEANRFQATRTDDEFHFTPDRTFPLLVVGSHGAGRTAALATDVAPHWVGPLVDWGPERLTACAPGSHEVEVGDLYAKFFRQLVSWTAGDGFVLSPYRTGR